MKSVFLTMVVALVACVSLAEQESLRTVHPGADFKSTRLVGRSAWNDRWIIVIPASAIDADREKAMDLIESGVKDVKLGIRAYARQGN